MCRSSEEYPPNGKRCLNRGSKQHQQEKRDAYNKRRREIYHANKRAKTESGVSNIPTSGLTEGQASYFNGSKAVDSSGNLVKLYHGSSAEFDSFDPTRVGQGNDAWGNGFYFTDKESVAKGYAAEAGSPTANVKEFYLNIQNPLYADGKETMSLNDQEFTSAEALSLLKAHPLAYIQPNDDDEMNPLGDYSPNFWDKEEWTQAELDNMWEQVAKEHFQNPSWPEMEGMYGKEYGSAYLHAVHKTTGHDGVIVDFGEDGKHYVAWFPEQMKLTSNENPDNTAKF